jgi:hypothetical protein
MQWICPQFDAFQNLACQYPPFVNITDIITGDDQVKQILIETNVKSSLPTNKIGKTGAGFIISVPVFILLEIF